MSTIYGDIELCGGGDTTYESKSDPKLLIIDTGGNDTYINVPSAVGGPNWASVVIDTSGNDKYLSDPVLAGTAIVSYNDRKNQGIEPGPAGAFMGYAYLFDLRGDDLYRSARCGLGSGRLGIGVIEDADGNDTYDAYADSIGFGMFGVGIVEDLNGKDIYSGFSQVGGVGQSGGFGTLIDRAGNDTYSANDTQIEFVSAQSHEHNDSLSFGVGNGIRRDYIDSHQLAGGVGVLLDDAGDDKYSAGVFGEGCGYFQGVGILRDKGGNDTYDGTWYVEGAAAHFAIGFLQDDQGDDHYSSTMHMAQGGGHDFAQGYLIDLAGNDTHVASTLSLGAANSNGIGLFLDAAGDDSYQATGISLGQCGDAPGGLRDRALGLGLFCDLGGNDTYPSGFSWAKNGTTQVNWKLRQAVPNESQLGIFYDH